MTLKKHLTQADIFLIAANLLPVFGVWFLGWNAKEIFIVYALETIIIGLFTIFIQQLIVLPAACSCYLAPAKSSSSFSLLQKFSLRSI